MSEKQTPAVESEKLFGVAYDKAKVNEDLTGQVHVACLPHYDTSTCTYVVWDPATMAAAVIDSAVDYEPNSASMKHEHADSVLSYVEEKKLNVEWVLETHAHADHLSAARYIKAHLNNGGKARVAMGANIQKVQKVFAAVFNDKDVPTDGRQWDQLFEDGEEFQLGKLTGKVMFTPGHTPACASYLIGDAVFTGDTLFHPDIGTARVDFPGGSAEDMFKSVQKLLALPPMTRNYIGHDYPGNRRQFTYMVTIGEQRKSNKQVKEGTTLEEYVKMRNARDATLGAPRLILPSLQYNIRAGDLPDAEDNGMSYFKLPVNGLASLTGNGTKSNM